MRVATERFPGRPVFDTAVSHALLRRVASGEVPETMRLYVPDDAVLFSLLDRKRPGFAAARAVAAERSFGEVIRLAGGHAALFHERCLAFSWAQPDDGRRCGIKRRFEQMSDLLARGLRRVGVDARVGEVAGEYCPGEYSVNGRGVAKLVGVGQRVVRGAAHVGGVIVVGDSTRLRDVLVPVYEALDLPWRPETAGAVEDEVPGVSVDDVRDAILEEIGASRPWQATTLDDATAHRAAELLDWHDPGASPRQAKVSASEKLVDARR